MDFAQLAQNPIIVALNALKAIRGVVKKKLDTYFYRLN